VRGTKVAQRRQRKKDSTNVLFVRLWASLAKLQEGQPRGHCSYAGCEVTNYVLFEYWANMKQISGLKMASLFHAHAENHQRRRGGPPNHQLRKA
jgi:hypothetical protein